MCRHVPSLSRLCKKEPTARLLGVVRWPLAALPTIHLYSVSSPPWRPRRRGPTRASAALPRPQTARFSRSTRLTLWDSNLGGASSRIAHVVPLRRLRHHQAHQTLRLQCLTTSSQERQPSVQLTRAATQPTTSSTTLARTAGLFIYLVVAGASLRMTLAQVQNHYELSPLHLHRTALCHLEQHRMGTATGNVTGSCRMIRRSIHYSTTGTRSVYQNP